MLYCILGGSMPSLEGSWDMVWPLLCCAMHVWLKANEVRHALTSDTDRPLWVNHEAFYGCWMVSLVTRCLCLCWAWEKWIRSLVCCRCLQFQVDTAVELAMKLHVCMDCDDSIIHVGFGFHLKWPYYGLVEACAPHEQWVEHWRAIRQHQTGLAMNREEKYVYMAANGGISQWFFLPYVLHGTPIELNRLQQLEQSVIQWFPNALNKT